MRWKKREQIGAMDCEESLPAQCALFIVSRLKKPIGTETIALSPARVPFRFWNRGWSDAQGMNDDFHPPRRMNSMNEPAKKDEADAALLAFGLFYVVSPPAGAV